MSANPPHISPAAVRAREGSRHGDGTFGAQALPQPPAARPPRAASSTTGCCVDIIDGEVVVRTKLLALGLRGQFGALFQTKLMNGRKYSYLYQESKGVLRSRRASAVGIRTRDLQRLLEWLDSVQPRPSTHPDLRAFCQAESATQSARDAAAAAKVGALGGRVLMTHQVEAARDIARNRGLLLWDSPGMGKTLTSLAGIHAKDAWPLLVVCPPSLVKDPWQLACEDMIVYDSALAGFKIYTWPPAPSTRRHDRPLDHEIIIISSGSLATARARGWLPQPGSVIIDEAHGIKNRRSNVSAAVRSLCEHVPDDGAVIAMTGTPIVNHPGDVEALLEATGRMGEFPPESRRILAQGKGSDLWQGSVTGDEEDTRRAQISLFHKALFSEEEPLALRRKRSETLNLPPMKHTVTALPPDEDFKAAYSKILDAVLGARSAGPGSKFAETYGEVEQQVLDDAIYSGPMGRSLAELGAILRGSEDDEDPPVEDDEDLADLGTAGDVLDAAIAAPTEEERKRALEVLTRALGARAFPLGTGADQKSRMTIISVIRKSVAALKAMAVAEHVNRRLAAKPPGSGRTLVFCDHRTMSVALGRALRCEALNGSTRRKHREAVLAGWAGRGQWPDPRKRDDVIVLSTAAFGAGLTLTEADLVIFAEQPWTPARQEQARDRVWRIGQTRPVEAETLIVPGTVDEYVAAVGERKRITVDAILDGHYVSDMGFGDQGREVLDALAASHEAADRGELRLVE